MQEILKSTSERVHSSVKLQDAGSNQRNIETGGFQKHQATHCTNNCYELLNDQIKYLEDSSAIQTVVSAVREVDLDHMNYARHNIYQHVYLNRLLKREKKVL